MRQMATRQSSCARGSVGFALGYELMCDDVTSTWINESKSEPAHAKSALLLKAEIRREASYDDPGSDISFFRR
jgi:hypothetical protein